MEALGESGTILLHDDFFGVSGPLVEDCSKMDFMEDCEDNCFLQGLCGGVLGGLKAYAFVEEYEKDRRVKSSSEKEKVWKPPLG
jgi:hypothetical protein